MTSKKSSVNPFQFTFCRTIKKNFAVPAIFFVIMFLVTVLFGIVTEINANRSLAAENGITFKELFADRKFILMNKDPFFIDICSYLMIGASVLTALLIFKYMMSKKSVNVYYSLGIKRTSLFWAKYLAGAAMLAVSVFVPLLISALINMAVLGNCKELWISAAYIFMMMFLSMLFCYSVTAAVCCRNGSLVESAFYSLALIFLPLIASESVEFLFGHLVYGSPFSSPDWVWYGGEMIVDTGSEINYFSSEFPIYDFAGFILPLSYGASKKYMDYSATNRVSEFEYIFKFDMPDFAETAIWFVILAAFSLVCAATYKKRKTEIAGFLGSDSVTRGLSAFAISSIGVIFILDTLYYLDRTNMVFGFITSLVVFFVVFAVLELATVRNFKKAVKNSWHFAVGFSVFAAVYVVFASGFLGYSSRLPDKSEIKSAAVSIDTGNALLAVNGSGYSDTETYSGETLNFALLTKQYDKHLIAGFNSEEDIENILDIHQKLINCKSLEATNESVSREYGSRVIPTKIIIVYTLSNGESFERIYPLANDEIMTQLASLAETKHYKNVVLSKLDNSLEGSGYAMQIDFESISVASPDFTNATLIPQFKFNDNLKDSLKQAIRTDIASGAVSPSLMSNDKLLGYILFGDFMQTTSSGAYIDESGLVTFENVEGISESLSSSTPPQKLNEIMDTISSSDIYRVCLPVYESMTETVSFLKANSLDGYMLSSSEPVEIKLWKIDENSTGKVSSYHNTSILLSGIWCNTEFKSHTMPDSAISVTDPAEIEKYSEAFRMSYLSCYEGYYAEMIFEDGSRSYGYVPFSLLR